LSKKTLARHYLGVSQKAISNYTNHIANATVDEAFQKFTSQKKEQ
tara:strand:- start:272 stop:406 length:135 start_codon:yes stop_codon:yes gene_type:complete